MASAGFAACMGASPETVLQAAEIGIGEAPARHVLSVSLHSQKARSQSTISV